MEKITYKKSLAAKLILGQDAIPAYQSIKDLCKTHKKVSTRLSFGKETISYGRVKVAVIKIVVRNISLHLALDPKDYENTKYYFKDVSDTKQGQIYPMRVKIKGSRSLKYALELLEDALVKAGATDLCPAEDVDYQELFSPRGFDALLEEGLIKKYVRTLEDDALVDAEEEEEDIEEELEDEPEEEETVQVSFHSKLLYEAQGQADHLYIVTNTMAWNPASAIPMKKNKLGIFSATATFPKNTHLEFKICRSKDWKDVEKGIWKEEIQNHYYYLTQDIEVEDLIHNFRID